MKTLLKAIFILASSIYAIYYFVGVETIIENSFKLFIGALIILIIMGFIIKAEEMSEKEAKEKQEEFHTIIGDKFVLFLVFILLFIVSLFVVNVYSKDILNKKTLIVFNFDKTPRYVTIKNKEYVLKPFSHKTIIARGKMIKIDNEEVVGNGRYLVNISKNFCYKIEPLLLVPELNVSTIMKIPKPYTPETIIDKVYYYPKKHFLVFPNEKFKYKNKDKSDYYVIIPNNCKWHI
jgi:hypothetical protein